MSRQRQFNGDDYPDAALKHLEDTRVLLAGARYDGAAYLAGYVVECALKTLILMETGYAHRSHDLADLNRTLRTISAQAGFRTQQLFPSVMAFLGNAGILAWKPGARYHAAHVTPATAKVWCQEAACIYSRIIGYLTLHGLI